MNKVKLDRYDFSEISFGRLLHALKSRANEIPHMIAWNFSSFSKENRERIKNFQGKNEGERCFIVANGPSLKITNLDLLSNEMTFGLNRIYLHFAESPFRPTYYVAVNELVLEQFSTDIAQLEMPKFLNWNQRSYFNIHDPQIAFIKNKMVIKDSFQKNLVMPVYGGGTVTYIALQIAYYMGFQKVVLVGLDHKYVEKGTPNKTELRSAAHDESHFHPNYFPQGMKWQLPDLLRSEMAFKIARQAFERDGRKIVDATIGGSCPIFEKVDYLSLFK
jgi:hypothetical protein